MCFVGLPSRWRIIGTRIAEHCLGEFVFKKGNGGRGRISCIHSTAMNSSETRSGDVEACFLKQCPHSSQVCIPFSLFKSCVAAIHRRAPSGRSVLCWMLATQLWQLYSRALGPLYQEADENKQWVNPQECYNRWERSAEEWGNRKPQERARDTILYRITKKAVSDRETFWAHNWRRYLFCR